MNNINSVLLKLDDNFYGLSAPMYRLLMSGMASKSLEQNLTLKEGVIELREDLSSKEKYETINRLLSLSSSIVGQSILEDGDAMSGWSSGPGSSLAQNSSLISFFAKRGEYDKACNLSMRLLKEVFDFRESIYAEEKKQAKKM